MASIPLLPLLHDLFEVPVSTLKAQINGRESATEKRHNCFIFTEVEEGSVEKWLLDMDSKGAALTLPGLEAQVEIIFKIAKHFNAILLLDEADAFMANRTELHDSHNRLVTVFLRKLEYYRGLLFLTSNRGIQFGDAILSRIHLTIEYEDLTKVFCRDLWRTFLFKSRTLQDPAVIEEEDIHRLYYLALNGREIKNIAAVAYTLVEANTTQVSYKYLELAAKSNKKIPKEFGSHGLVDGMYI